MYPVTPAVSFLIGAMYNAPPSSVSKILLSPCAFITIELACWLFTPALLPIATEPVP